MLNYWFYLLSVGGTGTNDIGSAYSRGRYHHRQSG
ncbi:MAG: hypothetical protein WKG07_30830 [Hymenobacter sp.]